MVWIAAGYIELRKNLRAEEAEILKSLSIEGDYGRGIGHCILGYVDEEPQCHPRKDKLGIQVDF